MSQAAKWRVLVGLEVHVQLQTQTKLFCSCPTKYGQTPNSQVCPVCSAMPGSMPVLNRDALELAVLVTHALRGTVCSPTHWDRKQYFYPDLPKGYQISQLGFPICQGGSVEFDAGEANMPVEPTTVAIDHAHLEEDAGKSQHSGAEVPAGRTAVDLNRAGTPLMEIVTKPSLSNGRQARMFLAELRNMLVRLGVTDGNMQEGSLRCDANVNLEITTADQTIRTPIVEIKNLNSFRAVENAIGHESERQWARFQSGDREWLAGDKETRGWDDERGETTPQRDKEAMADYRYMPDADLPPVLIDQTVLDRTRQKLQNRPEENRRLLREKYGLSPYDSRVIVGDSEEAIGYFRHVADQCGNAKLASNWIQQDVMAFLSAQNYGFNDYPVSAAELGKLLKLVDDNKLNPARGRDVLAEMIRAGGSVDDAIKALGVEQVDDSQIREVCQKILADNPAVVAEIRGGKPQAIGPLIGQVRKKLPDANPAVIREILLSTAGIDTASS